ncbi:ABC transporter ATP-binding protein, partial [Spirillospora sp. NPDC046719]
MSTAQGLRVADVTVRVGGVTAVRGAALTVPPGTVAGLVGPDGAGRGWRCDVIAGLRRPADGSVHLGVAE